MESNTEVIDLVAIAKPLPKVRFPNGSEHQLVPFNAVTWKKFRAMQATTDPAERGALVLEVLRCCVPSATDDDVVTLGLREDAEAIIAACTRHVDLAERALGNSESAGGEEASTSRRSPPPTTSSTPSPESGVSAV